MALTLSGWLFTVATFASEIREFSVPTLEQLGNELTRVSETRDKGATTPARKRAQQTAKVALKGKLFDIHYDCVVLDDPDGNGFLVYALGNTGKKGDTVVAGHARVTVSPDGEKAERVDRLSHTLMIDNKYESAVVEGYHREMFVMSQIVSNKPVETLIYSSYRMGLPIAVAAAPDGQMWTVRDGKIIREKEKVGSKHKK